MRKLLFVLFAALFLAACGDDELNDFAESFNQRASSEGVPGLIVEDFSDIIEEDDEAWRYLYESDKYYIKSLHEGNELTGYRLAIDSSEPFEKKEGTGYRASVVMAQTLGISASDFSSNFDKALRTDLHSYTDGDYDISFVHIGYDSSLPTSIYIRYEKN